MSDLTEPRADYALLAGTIYHRVLAARGKSRDLPVEKYLFLATMNNGTMVR